MATGTDCVIGTYAHGEDETTVGSLTKAIQDLIDAHDRAKAVVYGIVVLESLACPVPQAMAIVYWAD